MSQPIIRGIQAVGAVDIYYRYNGKLTFPAGIKVGSSTPEIDFTDTSVKALKVAGFRLDGEFLRAVQQIASSVQIPILGGGAIALTNNNRSGQLTINCTRVSTPDTASAGAPRMHNSDTMGAINVSDGSAAEDVYDLTLIAQAQQAQPGGDSLGATLTVVFKFNGLYTSIQFYGCTVATVDPIGLSGNDAVNYNVTLNYLDWKAQYSTTAVATDTEWS